MSSGCWKKLSLSDTSRLCLGLCTVGTIRIFLHNQRSVLLEYFDPTIRLADKIKKCPPFVLLLSNTKYLSDYKLKRGWPKRLLLFWFTFPYIDDHVVYILIWDYLSHFSYSLFSLFESKRCNQSCWLIKGVWFKGLYKRTDKQIWSNILLLCRYYNHTFTQSDHTRYYTYFDYRFFQQWFK